MFCLPSTLAEVMGCKNSKHSRSVDDEKKEAKKIIAENNSTAVAADEKFIQNGQQNHSCTAADDLTPKNVSQFRVASLKEKLHIRHSSNPQPPSTTVEIIIPDPGEKTPERKLTSALVTKNPVNPRRKWSVTRARKVTLTLHVNPDQLKDEDIHELMEYFPFPGHHAEQLEIMKRSPRASPTIARKGSATSVIMEAAGSRLNKILRPKRNSLNPSMLQSKCGHTLEALALKSFDLTFPAVTVSWLRERLKNFTQCSGHEGTIIPASNHTLWKRRGCESCEGAAYAKLMNDVCCPLVPKFFREVEHNGDYFIEIEDLTHQFEDPAIMDVKMGTRTFLESEVTNAMLRQDLYQKMTKVDPSEPTEEENAAQAITKLRYMQFRERESSTAAMGFRVEAIKLPGSPLQTHFQKVRTRDQIVELILKFLNGNTEMRAKFLERLIEMREKIEKSPFFQMHEIIGSSILLLYDEKHAGMWMIDFAKALPVENGLKLDHRTPWTMGNHEDGYLVGMDNLIDVMGDQRLEEVH